MVDGQEVALKVLIKQRHMSYDAFCREWNRVAKSVDGALVDSYPGHAQYYRWLRGQLTHGRPYPDACRVLEAMFPGWSIERLFSPITADSYRNTPSAADIQPGQGENNPASKFADLAAAYLSRAHFMSDIPVLDIFESASLVRASGLSLNLLAQYCPDTEIRRLVGQGTRFQLIFLNPECEAMKLREREEGYSAGFLARLTEMNIKIMRQRVRNELDIAARDRFEMSLSDETVRFNIILVDDKVGVFQPYLPEARGVDSPTFVIRTNSPESGFFHVFDQVFTSLWKRATLT